MNPDRRDQLSQGHLNPHYFGTDAVHRRIRNPNLNKERLASLSPPGPKTGSDDCKLNLPFSLPTRQHAIDDLEIATTEPSSSSTTINFPEILFKVVSNPSYKHIISWLPDGRRFVIRDRNLFTSQILPQYFDGTKYASFMRRLKRWKFERRNLCGSKISSYENKYFVRDMPELLIGMIYGMEDAAQQLAKTKDKDQWRKRQVGTDETKTESNNNKRELEFETGSSSDSAHDAATIAATFVLQQEKMMLQHQLSKKPQDNHSKKSLEQRSRSRGVLPLRQWGPSPHRVHRQIDDDVFSEAMKANRKLQLQLKRAMNAEMVLSNEVKKIGQNQKEVKSDTDIEEDSVAEAAIEVHSQGLKLTQRQLVENSHTCSQDKYLRGREQQQSLVHATQYRSTVKMSPRPYTPDSFETLRMSTTREVNGVQSKLHQHQSNKQSRPKQQEHSSKQHDLRLGTSNLKMQQELLNQGPALFDPEGSNSVSRWNASITNKLLKAIRNRNPNTSSIGRNTKLASRNVNIISPLDTSHQQQASDIQRQVLLEMPCPSLPAMKSVGALSTGKYPHIDSNVNFDGSNETIGRTVSGQDIRDPISTKSQFMDTVKMKTNRKMIEKIVSSSRNHKEIMIMAAKDLRSRAGEGHLAGELQKHHQISMLPLDWLSQEKSSMQQQQLLPSHRQKRITMMSPSKMHPHLQAPVPSRRTGCIPHAMLRQLQKKVEMEMETEMAEAPRAEAAAAVLRKEN